MIQPASRQSKLGVLLCAVLTTLAPLMLFAISLSIQPHAFAASAVPAVSSDASGHVTIIVLDMSGSMAMNDPLGIRCSAADAYIDLSGINDYIGIVGLDNNNGNRTGNNNFQEAIAWTPQPLSTDTLNERETLRSIIKTKSNSCHPDFDTPTYDALVKAFNMLDNATRGKQLSGSVILLTDGTPDPDTNAQIEKIQTELVPMFKGRGWPIDTIALGQDSQVSGLNITFHDFLSGVSDGTSGKFYDDTKGVVESGPNGSPLNITPFFVDIFTRRVGRTPIQGIDPTPLDGGIVKRNFYVPGFATSLDVVVVKDQPDTTVSLLTPNGQVITPTSGAAIVSQDNYYVIFSIDEPINGTWEVDVSGSGQFLVRSLTSSNIKISIGSITLTDSNIPATDTLPLGHPLKISAFLTSNGQSITDNSFQVRGTIHYNGNLGQYDGAFVLNDRDIPGNYIGYVTVPTDAPAGSYDIQLSVNSASQTDVLARSTRSVRLELFPVPLLLSPQTKQPTDQTISTTVLLWPDPLSWLYSLPGISVLSGWALQGYPAQPTANLPGVVQWQGRPYTDPATMVQAQAYQQNVKTPIPVTITLDSPGVFDAQFSPLTSGTYSIVFLTSGNYKDSHGDFGPTSRRVIVTVAPASDGQVSLAYLITFFNLLMAVFVVYLVKFWLTPRPFGEWSRTVGGEFAGNLKFSRAHRGPIQWFLERNQLRSRQAGMAKGLLFKFGYGGSIQVRPDGAGSRDWQLADGSSLRPDFQRVRELIFSPGGGTAPSNGESSYYTISSQTSQGSTVDDEYGAYDAYRPTAGQKRKRSSIRWSFDDGYSNDAAGRAQKRSRRWGKQRKNGQWNDPFDNN